MRDMILLIELDSKVCRSVARKLRNEHIYCRILPACATGQEVLAQDARGLLLAGADAGEPASIPPLDEMLATGLPMLAMGDAALALAQHTGGILGDKAGSAGVFAVQFEAAEALFAEMTSGERYIPALRCMTLAASCHPIAQTEQGILGFRAAGKQVYGLAFLPETNDPDGTQLLINFCRNVCGCTLWWNRQVFMDRARETIASACEDTEALCAISGGLDSGVCAVLGNQAIGHRLHCLFIDTGLLRKDETDEVLAIYRDQLGLNVHCVDAREEILTALQGISSSTAKDAVLHQLLQQIFMRAARNLPGVTVLLQGTNYSDVLDTPPELAPAPYTLLEPVRELFKDEIRAVGDELFLPESILRRQPFPGTGLALRIFSAVTEEKLAILREADALFRREIESAGLNKRLFQYYATLADEPDPDTSGMVVILRAVQVIDGNVALAYRLPYDLLERVTDAILSTLPGVRRVLYDFTPSKSYRQNT